MKTLIGISGTTAIDTWGQQAQQTTIIDTTNRKYPRTIILSTQGVRVARLGVAVGFPISALTAAAILLEPTLSWPPIITSQPVNGNAQYGGAASFGLIASAELSVTYQWQYNNGSGWSNAVGGVYSVLYGGIVLSISDCSGLNGYTFQCIVTNASGSTTTNVVTLAVQDPGITLQPVNTHAISGIASFTITAHSATSLTYAWSVSTDGGTSWAPANVSGLYSGNTTNTLTITGATSGMNNYLYRCLVTNSASPTPISQNSAIATLLVP